MGRVWKAKTYKYLCSLALVFSCLNNSSSDCFPIGATCNSSCTAELATDESWIKRRILTTKTITYGATNPKKPFCDANVLSSCIGPDSKFYEERPCNYQNLCDRPF